MGAFGDLNHRDDKGRPEEVAGGETIGPAGRLGHDFQGDAGGIGSEDRCWIQQRSQGSKQAVLHLRVLADRFDHDGAGGYRRQVGGERDTVQDRRRRRLVQPAGLDQQGEIAADLAARRIERAGIAVDHRHRMAGGRKHLGDAMAHQARAQNSDRFRSQGYSRLLDAYRAAVRPA